MKVRIPLEPRSTLILRIPMDHSREESMTKVSLKEILQGRIATIAETLYEILSGDMKEQEKRRKLVNMYMQGSNELTRMICLVLYAKYFKYISQAETKMHQTQEYIQKQESLADRLVYKCEELKTGVSSAYDVKRAIDVLLRRSVDFPSAILDQAKCLNTRTHTPTEYPRLNQLIKIHIAKSGIWKNDQVNYTVQNGKLILETYGFKSTLILGNTLKDPQWKILSIEPLLYEGKNISPKIINSSNILKEIVNITKYTNVVLEIEHIYKQLKQISDKNLFQIEILGDTKNYNCILLETYRAQIEIVSSWNGPVIQCTYTHQGQSIIMKENILTEIFSETEKSLRRKYQLELSFTLEKGLLFRNIPLFSLKDLKKQIETIARVQYTVPFATVLERVNVLNKAELIELSLIVKNTDNQFIGIQYNHSHSHLRLFYGVHQVHSTATALEIPINPSTQETKQILTLVTEYKGVSLIERIIKYSKEIIILVSIYRSIPLVHLGSSILTVSKSISLSVPETLTVSISTLYNYYSTISKSSTILDSPKSTLEKILTHNQYITSIKSSIINVTDLMYKEEIESLAWITMIISEIHLNKRSKETGSQREFKLPKEYSTITIKDSIFYDCQIDTNPNYNLNRVSDDSILDKNRESSITLYWNKSSCNVVYSGGIGWSITSDYYLLNSWITSSIISRRVQALQLSFAQSTILEYNGLISTIPVYGVFGGKLNRTYNTSILYRIQKTIEFRWKNTPRIDKEGRLNECPSYSFESAFESIPRLKEVSNGYSIDRKYLNEFLGVIKGLLSKERVSMLGNKIVIRSNKDKSTSVYGIEYLDRIICTKEEGLEVPQLEEILNRAPNLEGVLKDLELIILPNE
ncbi:hypothetical protein NEOKW01_0964 [Nematocida sp. AWRm80]|nr:hypothetical protein NEOKW01_0964 [Nematocida sp. AWRm80]